MVRGLSHVRCRAEYHRAPCLDRFYICSIPPHWGILSDNTTWAIIFYADDTQLYMSFNSLSGDDQAYSVSQVESCVRDIDCWMSCNKLKLYRDKTELLVKLSVQNIGHAHL